MADDQERVIRTAPRHDADEWDGKGDPTELELWEEHEGEPRRDDNGDLQPEYHYWLVSPVGHRHVDRRAVRTGS